MFKSVLSKSRALPWKIGDQVLSCQPSPLIMGIVNVTPDSFFDGGQHNTLDAAFQHSMKLLQEGAVILDIGGESSRPGSAPVSVQEELDRVCPLVERLAKFAKNSDAPTFYMSVDTVKSKVAQETMNLGAHIINDISACAMDKDMPAVVAKTGASVVLNHMRGNFGTMQQDFKPYENVVQEVREELLAQAKLLLDLGVEPQKICLDPGIGFGKTVQDNIDLMKSVEDMLEDGYPVLIGTSRKSYIGKMAGLETSDRLIPTVTAGIVAALGGASIIRVHDVKEAKESMLYLEGMNGSV
ncbi:MULTISPECIES: dihydropteroate synthase [unclassified Fibrobacter]|uniref:dihydropteroate synthase n=1 Tax=unclassified Fibrobacter TaxID=2634177 RepID=UPI0009179D52|nr:MULTISPECIES: dihydropteroate synthase [Fibrobacter]MCQ2100787.1 dihydropteroate synthase [Fibrobacter sp.]MCL4102438.1 Dihydropteroate synthase [Fibrobacter succinogenes]OWV01507.1 dihydropteroate synthase [Fibrobacter sp. UWH3]OWV15088.1 dihydropteroate synthase [Fibrobacter sp. UWH1]SHL78180.1 dihydropteroate synthase [Fibrobacter sp. UWH5]